MSIAKHLSELGIKLPDPPKQAGSYVPVVQVGSLLFTSGAIPWVDGKLSYKGKLGQELDVKKGQQAARTSLLNALSVVQAHLGDLERVMQVVRLSGYVVSARHFYEQAKVLDGASDLLVQIFGERGKHARTAVGVRSLPLSASVMLDLIISV